MVRRGPFSNLYISLCELASTASSIQEEATLRQRFLEVIGGFLDESGISRRNVRLEERIVRGRSDARIGAIVFEIKLPRPRGEGITAAIRKMQGYIYEHNVYQPQDRPVRGIAYDGQTIALLDEEGNIVADGSPAELIDKLEAWLLSLGGKAVMPEDVVDRLGSSSSIARDAIRTFREVFYDFHTRIGFIDEVFQMWRGLYGCATNLNEAAVANVRRAAKQLGFELRSKAEVEEYLFFVESYLATLLKLLMTRVAVQHRLVIPFSVTDLLRYQPMARFAELEQLIPQLPGVFEHDVFLWFVDAARVNMDAERKINSVITTIAENIDDVDLTGAGHDFLRLVYQRFFDPATRRALGEFYTSPEIVDEVLDAAGFEGELGARIVDISCGSGTFLVRIIKRMLRRNKHRNSRELLRLITQNVIGVDIHPFAVAMARVNYILAVAELLTPSISARIPIYWADSLSRLSRQQESIQEFGMSIDVHIPGLGKFRLPSHRDVNWDMLFHNTKEVITRFRGPINFEDAWQRFRQRMPEDIVLRYEATLQEFLRGIVDRHNQSRDMRWLPLLQNVLSVERLRGSCDYIVGNPPWVRIHNIEAGLRERISEDYVVCKNAGWDAGVRLSGGGRGFGRQIDLSIAFVERGLELLKDGGVLAYVITSKILQTLYANALRKKLLQECTIKKLSDYSLYARPLFEGATNYPLILAVQKKRPSGTHGVNVKVCNPNGNTIEFTQVQSELPLLLNDVESPWILVPPRVLQVFRKMQSSMSITNDPMQRNRLLGETGLKTWMGVKTSLNAVFVVKHIEPSDSPNEVVIRSEGYYSRLGIHERQKYTTRIEKGSLRPILRGKNIEAWRIEVQDYIIWTHDDETGDVLEALPPRAKSYFENHAKALQNRSDYKKTMPIWTIFRVSPEKLKDKVVWHELARMLECAYVPSHILDKQVGERLIVPIQTVYLIPVEKPSHGLILSALLNSLPIRTYAASFAERARGAYFRHISWVVGLLPIPPAIDSLFPLAKGYRFSQSEENPNDLEEVISISRQLHTTTDEQTSRRLERRLNELIAELYGLDKDDLETLADYSRFILGKGQLKLPL